MSSRTWVGLTSIWEVPQAVGLYGSCGAAQVRQWNIPNASQPNPGSRGDGSPCIRVRACSRALWVQVFNDTRPAKPPCTFKCVRLVCTLPRRGGNQHLTHTAYDVLYTVCTKISDAHYRVGCWFAHEVA